MPHAGWPIDGIWTAFSYPSDGHGVAFYSAETEIKLTRSKVEAYTSHVNEGVIKHATQLTFGSLL